MKKIAIAGGPAVTICDAPAGRGASWGLDNTIALVPHFAGGVSLAPASGGVPRVLTKPDEKTGDRSGSHRWPEWLPGGETVLYAVGGGPASPPGEYHIEAVTVKTGERRVLAPGGARPRYLPTGHLLYGLGSTLMAAPFDARQVRLTGPAVPVLEGVSWSSGSGMVDFDVSDTGALVYLTGAETREQWIVSADRKGVEKPLPAPRRPYVGVRVSPDGQRLAVNVSEGRTGDVWVYDLARTTLTRLTFQGGNSGAVWTPDGRRIAFLRRREAGRGELLWVAADGSGQPEVLASGEGLRSPQSFSPDGKSLVFANLTFGASATRMAILPLEGERKPRPLADPPLQAFRAEASPGSTWLAYDWAETGRSEVYVRPFPGPGGKWQVSTEGGYNPRWSASGRELFYNNGRRILAVAIEPGSTFRAGTPQVLFEAQFSAYDVSPDGQRFYLVKSAEEAPQVEQAHFVLEWFEELKARVPAP